LRRGEDGAECSVVWCRNFEGDSAAEWAGTMEKRREQAVLELGDFVGWVQGRPTGRAMRRLSRRLRLRRKE